MTRTELQKRLKDSRFSDKLSKTFRVIPGSVMARPFVYGIVCAVLRYNPVRDDPPRHGMKQQRFEHLVYMRLKQLGLIPRRNYPDDVAWYRENGRMLKGKDAMQYFCRHTGECVAGEDVVPGARKLLSIYDIGLTEYGYGVLADVLGNNPRPQPQRSAQQPRRAHAHAPHVEEVDEEVNIPRDEAATYLALCMYEGEEEVGSEHDDIEEVVEQPQQPAVNPLFAASSSRAPANFVQETSKYFEKYEASQAEVFSLKKLVEEKNARIAELDAEATKWYEKYKVADKEAGDEAETAWLWHDRHKALERKVNMLETQLADQKARYDAKVEELAFLKGKEAAMAEIAHNANKRRPEHDIGIGFLAKAPRVFSPMTDLSSFSTNPPGVDMAEIEQDVDILNFGGALPPML